MTATEKGLVMRDPLGGGPGTEMVSRDVVRNVKLCTCMWLCYTLEDWSLCSTYILVSYNRVWIITEKGFNF